MPIRELFHVMTMVDDFDPAQDVVDDLFAPEMMFSKSWSDFDKRWASISLIGSDFSFELMEASKSEADAGAPLPKFARRFGQHLHSFAWYVDRDDMPGLVASLIEHGVRVVRPDGSLIAIDEVGDVPMTVFTHGRDTFGQMEFQAWNDRDPRFADEWSDDRWRDEHPLGLQRLQSTSVLVHDLDRARRLFADVLGGQVVSERDDDDAARTYVLVGTDTMVELVHPKRADSREGSELAANGELPNAMTLLVRDLDAARRHVEKIGVPVVDEGADAFVADTAATLGTTFTITTARIPGDPRDA
ncbi:MAG TPA: VOC family protein [Acidimicrobiia bacterium]|nr:VOC family protein [Acidimicrobiia bacterium]